MKLAIFYTLLSLFLVHSYAQEKVIVLSDTMFSAKGSLDFSNMDGWIFRADCTKDLSGKSVNTRGWKKLKPTQLSTDQSDSSGTACGWFRIKIRPDNSFLMQALGVINNSRIATDLFIDGNYVKSFGNTGYLGSSYSNNPRYSTLPFPISLQTDSTYVLALRVVYVNPPNQQVLASSKPYRTRGELLALTNNSYLNYLFKSNKKTVFYNGLTISITIILSVLFLMIYLLNRSEINVRRFAIGSTALALLSINLYLFKFYETVSNLLYTTSLYFAGICAIFFICYTPFILRGVLSRNGNSIRTLSRAQWCIIIGFSVSVIFLLIPLVTSFQGKTNTIDYSIIYFTASPLGMLGYVAFRFKEMIVDIQTGADRIVALSEEKRIQAENQQVILEEEVERQTRELKDTLTHLQDTQQQLIQSEKMASLGELTAGIAHEIQNPLNFVKNFSEVSVDLLAEMKVELEAGNTEEITYITGDIVENLKKIIHHGNRADSIVKGMLLHSRSGSGIREATDINMLADEYLRLGYHGLRAKDKTFNATIRTDYDEAAGSIQIVQQDMGRVLLNLIVNAFYATQDKKKKIGDGYEPQVTVRTVAADRTVLIQVSDNGNGIPEDVKEKIFQPFFTTKPTGEGTGLGLSIAYDVIKSHGGELRVESTEGKGTTFSIILNKTDL